MTFMTDALGVSVILGLTLLDRTSRAVRVVLGLLLFWLAWALVYRWRPHAGFVELTKELLTGAIPNRVLAYSVPMLPWFGIYLLCTTLGEHIGKFYARGDTARVEKTLFTLGVSAVAVSVLLRVTGW